jgi:2-methylisocitrate lyase-like PEP mutase family enzyme
VSGIQIEDQDWPKRCGHEPGRRIVSIQEMVGRIRAAVDTRQDEQTVIVARTDARSSEGIQAAIERANLYAEAGADVAFVESPESVEEMRLLNQAIETPTLANQVEGGRTPMLPAKELEELGYGLAIYPNSITRVFASIGNTLYMELLKTGSTQSMSNQMLDHRGLWNLFEYPAFIELENNYTSKDDKK